MSGGAAARPLGEWDRAAARAAEALADFERTTRDAERAPAIDAVEAARALRAFATRENLATLTEQRCTQTEEPERVAASDWMKALLVARVGLAEAAAYARALADRTTLDRSTGKRVAAPSALDHWSELLRARSDEEGQLALDALATRGDDARTARREWRARRHEAAHLLGLAHPLDAGAPLAFEVSAASAEALLAATRDLAKEIFRRAASRDGSRTTRTSSVATIRFSLARSEHHGWPARVTPRWLGEQLAPMLDGRRVDPQHVPPTLGASSFLRAAWATGREVRRALRPRTAPFVTSHAPFGADGYALGGAFALTLATPEFQRRALGLGAGAARDAARSLAHTLLLDVRRAAASLLLEGGDEGRFAELSEAAFGGELPDGFAASWPRLRHDTHAAWLGRVAAPRRVALLRARYDEDFFLNPRTAQTVVAWSTAPAAVLCDASAEALAADVKAWAHLLEEALA